MKNLLIKNDKKRVLNFKKSKIKKNEKKNFKKSR